MSGTATTASDVVVLLARARSGTHPLRDVLGSHPAVFATPEVFHANPHIESDAALAERVNFFRFLERDPAAYVTRSVSRARQEEVYLAYLDHLRGHSPKRYLLLDVKYNSTHHFDGPWRTVSDPPSFFRLVRQHRLRVLHLTRKNYLRYYLSLTEAQRKGEWFTESPAPDSPMEVDVAAMLRTMASCLAEDAAVEQALAGYKACLTVEYDGLFDARDARPSAAFLEQVAEWLSIDPQRFATQPRFRKQSRLGLADRITNYEAVEEALRGTPFEYCLADESMYRDGGT